MASPVIQRAFCQSGLHYSKMVFIIAKFHGSQGKRRQSLTRHILWFFVVISDVKHSVNSPEKPVHLENCMR